MDSKRLRNALAEDPGVERAAISWAPIDLGAWEVISCMDYKLPDGQIDWKAYSAASAAERKRDVDSGRYCYSCGEYIIFGNKGYRQQCRQCESLRTDAGEITHDKQVRCPKCKHTMVVADADLYSLYGDGEHDISCQSCGHDFQVSTHVSHSFTSPPLIDLTEEDAEDESA